MNKYHARKTYVDGIGFDSAKEAQMYQDLKLMAKAREIKNLRLQPYFCLLEGFTNGAGKKCRPIGYSADFSFYDNRLKRFRVLDCKGYRTKTYMMKKKMFDKIMKDQEIYLEEEI